MRYAIYIIACIFCILKINAQNAIKPAIPAGKNIISEVLILKTASKSSLNGFVRTPLEEKVKLTITYPENLTIGEHELIIEMEAFPEEYNNYALHNFDFGLQCDKGAITCAKPDVQFMNNGEYLLHDLVDKSKRAAAFYIVSSIAYTASKFIPIWGAVASGTELLADFFQWLDTDNTNWVKVWQNVYEYDYYNISTPLKTNYMSSGKVKYLRIALPITIIDPSKRIVLDLNFLNVRTTYPSIDDQWASLKENPKTYVINEGVHQQNKHSVVMESSTNSITNLESSINSTYSLKTKSFIIKEKESNFFNLEITPENLGTNQTMTINEINIQFLSKKGDVLINDLPDYEGINGPLKFVTARQTSRNKFLFNAVFFAGGKLATYIEDGKSIKNTASLFKDGINISAEITEGNLMVPYYDGVAKQYFTENYYDSFILPSFRPGISFKGNINVPVINIKVPFQAYEKTPVASLAIQCKTVVHTKPQNLITSHSATTIPVGFYGCIPLTATEQKGIAIKKLNSGKAKIGFIIDSSGSMKENDPKNIRKEGIQQILDLVDQEDDFFIVDFDSRGRWLNSDNYTGWDKLRLRRSIQSIDSDGNTNVGAGLITMKNAFSTLSDISNTGVILLTDGKGGYQNEAEWFAQNNIPIYTISYRQMADSRLMNEIAEVTGGIYTQADDEEDVVSAFLAFYAKLKNNNRFISVKGSLNNCIPESNQFYVDPDTREMAITVNWQKDPLNVSLIQPNGIRIAENHPDVQLNIGRNYKILKIDRPLSGKWNIEVSCNGASGTQPYLVEASGDSPLKIELNGGQSQNGIIQFNLDESDGLIDLNHINATVSLETPNNQTFDISDKFKSGAFSYFPTRGGGNYKFTMNMTGTDLKGQHFSRVYQRTVNTGSFVPSYISSVTKKNGNFINATMGTLSGNRYGMKCIIYNQGGSPSDPIAIGYVINLTQDNCTIELNEIRKTIPIMPGCIVQMDVERWMNDY